VRRWWPLAQVLLLIACSATAATTSVDSAAKTHIVTIEAMQFNPQALTVQRGDRIKWVNKDPLPHSATAAGAAFDSRSIEPGASWSYVALKPGNYAYACTFHPTMHATLTVR
jgi:plastocyanin